MLERCARNAAILLLACAPAPAIFAAPPAAATNLSIDQLDQLLKQMHGQDDVKVARRIAGIQLTERAGAARLAQWEADLPGDRSRKALMEVGDASAFLDLPAAETPSPPPPDAETRKQILARGLGLRGTNAAPVSELLRESYYDIVCIHNEVQSESAGFNGQSA